jgi:cytidylate kinase
MPGQLHRYADALERAQRHWHSRHGAAAAGEEPGRALTVALEREAGTCGAALAQELGKRLGWPVYDHELLEVIAQEMGLRVSLLETVDERRQGWLKEAFQRFAEVPQVSENTYVRHLFQTLLSLGAHGHCIIVGRGAAQVLPAASTLRVRLVAALKDRVTLAAQRLGLSEREASQWVEDTDRERVRFVQEHFRRDPTDVRQYDLVLCTSRWTVGEAAELIVQALHCLEARVAGGR